MSWAWRTSFSKSSTEGVYSATNLSTSSIADSNMRKVVSFEVHDVWIYFRIAEPCYFLYFTLYSGERVENCIIRINNMVIHLPISGSVRLRITASRMLTSPPSCSIFSTLALLSAFLSSYLASSSASWTASLSFCFLFLLPLREPVFSSSSFPWLALSGFTMSVLKSSGCF